MQDTSGVHVWLVLGKAFQALGGSCGGGLEPEPDRPRRLGFPCARGAAPQGAVAGVLSKEERLILLRLLKKLGKGGEDKA